jgi:hypothetical protein
MNPSTITAIEKWIVNAIRSIVGDGIYVKGLADEAENEGIAQRSSMITVTFSGANNGRVNTFPTIIDKSIDYTITYIFQSYLTETPHEAASSAMEKVESLLTGRSPTGTGILIQSPIYITSSRFKGISENSQYVYEQNLNLTASITYSDQNLDPCVSQGNCGGAWPPEGVVTDPDNLPPGSVILPDGSVLLPCPPTGVEDCDPRTFLQGSDLMLCDGTLLIENWTSGFFDLRLRGQTTEGSYRVDVYDTRTQLLVKSILYCLTRYRLATLNLSLWNSRVAQLGNSEMSSLSWSKIYQLQVGSSGYLKITVSFSTNPLNPTAEVTTVPDGTFVMIRTGVKLTVGGFTWYKVQVGSTIGWLLSPDGTSNFIDLIQNPVSDCDPTETSG